MLPSLSNLALHTSRVNTGVGTEGGINDQLLADMERKKALNALRKGRPRSSSRSSQAASPASDEAESTQATDTAATEGTDETKAVSASESESDDDSSEDETSQSSHARFDAIASKVHILRDEIEFIKDYLAGLDESIEKYVKAEVDEVEAGFQGDLVEAYEKLEKFVTELTGDIEKTFKMYTKTDKVVEGNRQRITNLETAQNGTITISAEKRAALVRANEMLKELLQEIRGERPQPKD
jgi:hypothetical protein